eukprot:722966-Prymnesium_polylepis.1
MKKNTTMLKLPGWAGMEWQGRAEPDLSPGRGRRDGHCRAVRAHEVHPMTGARVQRPALIGLIEVLAAAAGRAHETDLDRLRVERATKIALVETEGPHEAVGPLLSRRCPEAFQSPSVEVDVGCPPGHEAPHILDASEQIGLLAHFHELEVGARRVGMPQRDDGAALQPAR